MKTIAHGLRQLVHWNCWFDPQLRHILYARDFLVLVLRKGTAGRLPVLEIVQIIH
jgi:hypothetical protein